MKKLIITICLGLFLGSATKAQSYLLIIQGEAGKFYLDHTVVAKENWYSVGRLYNISPKVIAPFNGLTIDKPLTIGQLLKIPLNAVNFSQSGKSVAGETLVPVYHTIREKEWMYHISTTYNKVPIESLEKWNHINRDQAKAGMQLIIGYLKVKTTESALASGAAAKPVAESAKFSSEPKPEETRTAQDGSSLTKQPAVSPSKPEPRPATQTTAAVVSGTTSQVNTYAASHQTGGYFMGDFSDNKKTLSGSAGTFKSTSGWQDGKYYALMNNVPVGTIIKVTSPSTNKSVFAKVLGQLPDMKESAGLSVRISNAAAAELGTGEGKFPVEIRY
jgi:LysM repeat protein